MKSQALPDNVNELFPFARAFIVKLSIHLNMHITKQINKVLTLRDLIDIQLDLGQCDLTGVTLRLLVSETMSQWIISLKIQTLVS